MSGENGSDPVRPWWKFGHVWMIIAGPAIVVIAGFVTLYLAVQRPDPVISEEPARRGAEVGKAPQADHPAALAPAVQARNHAATGAPPTDPPAPKP